MPRLLLVDDNPSIHKIAETLLASSDVQLVSCGSGDQALALVHQGDRFDVALLDISMLGMDGWTLLQRLREHESTALLPVAMMAGVLDIVDPEKLRLAPIQGFLKKPVELRDLGDRIRRLLETPVAAPDPDADLLVLEPGDLLAEAPESPESPAPGELEFQAAPDTLEFQSAPETLEFQAAPEFLDAEAPAAALPEPLDLEELDLESLRNLPAPAAPELDAEPPAQTAPDASELLTVPEFLLSDTLPEAVPAPPSGPDLEVFDALDAAEFHFADEPADEHATDLPDLGPAADEAAPAALPPAPSGLLGSDDPFDWSDESDSLVGLALGEREPFPTPAFEFQPAAEATTVADLPEPAPEARDSGTEAELPPLPGPANGLDLAAALIADPVAMDRLAEALVARLGDKALREIAWEIMPELAERLRRKEEP